MTFFGCGERVRHNNSESANTPCSVPASYADSTQPSTPPRSFQRDGKERALGTRLDSMLFIAVALYYLASRRVAAIWCRSFYSIVIMPCFLFFLLQANLQLWKVPVISSSNRRAPKGVTRRLERTQIFFTVEAWARTAVQHKTYLSKMAYP